MNWRILVSVIPVLTGGCASTSVSTCPETSSPAVTKTATPGVAAVEAPTQAGGAIDITSAVAFEPNASTPPAVREQFGQLVGVWTCHGSQRQPDGSFKDGPGASRWTFFYTLGAQAVGDVFEPPKEAGGPVGINLRVYRPETDSWTLAWTTPKLQRYDHYEARQEGATLVMRGEIEARGKFPSHAAKITFYDMTESSFEWRLEAGKPGSDGPWQEFSRIHCDAEKPPAAT